MANYPLLAVKEGGASALTSSADNGTLTAGLRINTSKFTVSGASGNTYVGGTVTVSQDGTGTDVVFYSATAGDNFLWDASAKKLIITGTAASDALAVVDGNTNLAATTTVSTLTDGTATLVGGAWSAITTLAMGGALSGATTIAGSGLASLGSLVVDDGSTIGTDSDTDMLTLTNAQDILVASDVELRFRDAALRIYSSADGQLDIIADTTVALSGAVTADSTIVATGLVTGNAGVTVTGGALTITNQAITQTTGGQVTFAGNLDADGGLDVSGATTALGTVTVGADTDGYDVKFFGDTTGKYWEWDESADQMIVSGSAKITGNLTVEGTTFSTDSETVIIADNHLYLNGGYTADAAQTGGLVVNYDPIATATEAITGITAATRVCTVASTTGFSAGDLVQISGTTDNDGLYEIASFVADTSITLDNTPANDFAQNSLAADAGAGGQFDKVNVSVIRCDTGGRWEVASGNSGALSFVNLARVTETDNISFTGATITITGSSSASLGDDVGTWEFDGAGAVSETGMTTFDLSPTGTMYLQGGGVSRLGDDTGYWEFDGAGAVTETGMTSLAVNPSGAITLTAGAASTWSTSSEALTLTSAAAATWSTSAGALTLDGNGGVSIAGNAGEIDVTTSGALDLNSGAGTWDASTLSLDSTDTTNLTMTANAAGAKVLTLSATNGGAGEGQMVISATDQLDVGDGTATLTFDAGAVSEAGMTSFTISPSGAVVMQGASGTSKYGDDTGYWEFDGAGAVTETGMTSLAVAPSGAITLTAGAASTWSTSDGALTIDGDDGVNIASNSNGEIDLTTTGALDLNGGTTTIDSSGAMTLTAADGQVLTVKGGDGNAKLTISAAGATSLQSESGQDVSLSAGNDLVIADANKGGSGWGTPMVFSDSSAEWDTYETNFGEVSILAAINQAASGGAEITLKAAEAITQHMLVGIADGDATDTETAYKADFSSNTTKADAIGIAEATAADGGDFQVKGGGKFTFNDDLFPAAGIPVKTDVGKAIFASIAIAGEYTLTAPSSGVSQKVGRVLETTNTNATTPDVEDDCKVFIRIEPPIVL